MAHRHKKHGGKVQLDTPGRGEEEKKEAHLKTGGAVKKFKHGGHVKGHKGHHRLDKRARGGGVGADKHPFSSAHVK